MSHPHITASAPVLIVFIDPFRAWHPQKGIHLLEGSKKVTNALPGGTKESL